MKTIVGKVVVLGYQGDYGEACRQSRKGAYTSDINSTDSEAPRKRISKKVQLSTSEEESSDELDVIIPNPPKDVFGSNKTNLEQTRIKERANKGNNQACNCLANKEQTEKLVLTLTKQYSLIYTKLQDISSDMARLAVHVERDKLPEKVDVLIYDLPLITEDALTDFEIFIDDVENYKKLIHFIKKIGGTTPYECVKRSLSRILTNSLADKFSWIGAKGKKAFKSLKLAKALIGVGKTSTVIRYVENTFTKQIVPTVGASFFSCKINVDDTVVTLQIWDTAGQERFKAMAPMFYRNANAALLIFDITSYTSFESMKSWVQELKVNVEAPMVLCVVGNKIDLADTRQVSKDEAMQYSKSIGASYLECSAMTDQGVALLFENLAVGLSRLSGQDTKHTLKVYDDDIMAKSSELEATDTANEENVNISISSIAHGRSVKSNCCYH